MRTVSYPINDSRQKEAILPQGTSVVVVGISTNLHYVVRQDQFEQYNRTTDSELVYPIHRDYLK